MGRKSIWDGGSPRAASAGLRWRCSTRVASSRLARSRAGYRLSSAACCQSCTASCVASCAAKLGASSAAISKIEFFGTVEQHVREKPNFYFSNSPRRRTRGFFIRGFLFGGYFVLFFSLVKRQCAVHQSGIPSGCALSGRPPQKDAAVGFLGVMPPREVSFICTLSVHPSDGLDIRLPKCLNRVVYIRLNYFKFS